MGRQFNPKFAIYTSLFFFLAYSGTILAQNPSQGAAAARDATRTRGRATTQRQAPPTVLASLDRRAAFTLPPIVIYYSRDGAEVAAKKSPNVEKRTDGIGESITIFYGSKKTVTAPTGSAPKSKDERLASNVAKPLPPKNSPTNAITSATTAVNSPARRLVAVDQEPTEPVTTSAQPESKPESATEKPIDEIAVDPKPSVTEPAAVVEPPVVKTDKNAKAAGNPTAEANADTASTKAVVPPSVSPVAEPIVATELKSEPPPPPPPAPNPSADTKRSTEAVPAILNPTADTRPVTETAVPPAANPSTDTKLSTEIAPNTKAAIEASSPTSADAKPAVETAESAAAISANTVALNNTAVQLTREQRYEEASDLLRRAIQAEPDTYKFHRNLSIVYEQMNKLNEALESAKIAVKLAPREPSALVQLCGVQLQLKEHSKALSCYEDLSKITPLDPAAQTFYGVALLGSGRVLDSLAVLEKAAAAQPNSSVTLNALGFVYFNEKRFPEAVSTFKKAVELAPDQHEMRLNLAIAHLANGNREGAISQYRVLKHENPKLAEQLYQILFRDKVVSVDQLKPR